MASYQKPPSPKKHNTLLDDDLDLNAVTAGLSAPKPAEPAPAAGGMTFNLDDDDDDDLNLGPSMVPQVNTAPTGSDFNFGSPANTTSVAQTDDFSGNFNFGEAAEEMPQAASRDSFDFGDSEPSAKQVHHELTAGSPEPVGNEQYANEFDMAFEKANANSQSQMAEEEVRQTVESGFESAHDSIQNQATPQKVAINFDFDASESGDESMNFDHDVRV